MAVSAFISIASTAVRAASLDLCADEYLLALAHDREIAAVSRLSQDPAESRSAARARRFPPYRGRLETLLPIRPDLLVAVGAASGRSTTQIARKLGWRVLILPYPDDPTAVVANLQTLAAALGHPARATPWRQRFDRLWPPSRTIDTVYLSGGGQSVSPDGLAGRWMQYAGLRQRPLQGGRITLEQLALHPPSLILRSTYRSGQVSLSQRWLDHPLVRHARTRHLDTDGRAWTCGGPPMFDEIERLRRAL